MSARKEPSGRRSIQIELAVAGRPDEVWQAIATAPGISAWLMPAEIEERHGKPVALTLEFSPELKPRSAITRWDPPQVFATQADGWMPGSPPLATEWVIEAQGDGCNLRIVQSLFANTDAWDNQLEGAVAGWSGFLRTLQLYLTHFRGERAATMKCMAPVAGSDAQAWELLTAALGAQGLSAGQRWTAPAGVPALSGIVEYVTADPCDALVRIDKPAPGIAALGTFNLGGPSMVALGLYLYGDHAVEIVAREQRLWEAWFQQRFPMPSAPRSET
jgi:uncharacterized protein YndB with AHSA1/START domain